ncbi:hypothetical protein [Azospirillum sp. sgz302134]
MPLVIHTFGSSTLVAQGLDAVGKAVTSDGIVLFALMIALPLAAGMTAMGTGTWKR